MRSHNSGNFRVKICIFERSNEKNYFSKTKIYFYKKTTPQLLEHIGLQNVKVGGKTNLGDLPLFVWCTLTLALKCLQRFRLALLALFPNYLRLKLWKNLPLSKNFLKMYVLKPEQICGTLGFSVTLEKLNVRLVLVPVMS